MFKLKSLKLHNFQSIRDADLDLHKEGLYLISGYNAIGGDSNGCGKSTVLAAIAYALWGKTPGGLKGDEVKNWDSTEYFVELALTGTATDTGCSATEEVYTVHRGSDKLELTIDGKVMKGRKRDVQDLINETFHSSDDVFFSSTLFTSNMSDYLTQMGDAAKKRLFKSILRLEKLDNAYETAKKKLDLAKENANKYEQDISISKDMIASSKSEIMVLKIQFDEYEASRQDNLDRASITPAKPDSTDTIFLLKAKQNTIRELEANKEVLLEKSIEANKDLNNLYEKMGIIVGSMQDLDTKIYAAHQLEGETTCDKCGGVLGKNYVDYVKELQTKRSALDSDRAQVELAMASIQSELNRTELSFDVLERHKEELITLERQYEVEKNNQKAYEDEVKRQTARFEEIKKEPNPYERLLGARISELDARIKNLRSLEDKFRTTTGDIDLCSFLKSVFSREGVGAQIIESSFGAIQSIANRYLSRICSENLFIKIVPQRELKSKALREEIDIFIVDKQKPERKIPYAALSGGQQQRVNIALLMSLYKFCRNLGINDFDFIILDEVLDLSLAAKGQSDVVSLLRELLQEVGQILVVSHKEAIAQDFDREIVIRREMDGISRIV